MHPDCSISKADRAILGITPAQVATFLSKIDKTPGHGPNGDCWVWTALLTPSGYGRLGICSVSVRAHRVAFFIANGHLPPPETPHVLHTCDNRTCCRADHFWLGTYIDNNHDMIAKGRANCGRGHRHGSRTKPESRARGERMGCAKLTAADVAEIRKRYARSEVTQDHLANDFGVSRTTISYVVHGRRWAHI